MNEKLERRLNKLEERAGIGHDLITLIVRFVTKAGGDCPANSARFGDVVLYRAENESEECFIERATAAASASAGESCARVIICGDEKR
jgi:hypothetical protein